jgi:Gpi18-like mannosyltransferase
VLETIKAQLKNFKFIILIFFATRLLTWFLGYYSFQILYPTIKDTYLFDNHEDPIIDIWSVWDSGWYLEIAQTGYSPKIHTDNVTSNQANYAFYPAFPLAMRLLSQVTDSYVLSGLIISNVALFILSIFLYLLIKDEFNENIAKNSILFLYAFPTSFVFSSVYSESLFLMLTVLSYYAFRKDKFILSGLLGGFGALTRNIGVLLLIPLSIELYKKSMSVKNKVYSFLKLLLIPFGASIFVIFIGNLTGNLFSVIKIQRGWDRELGNPIMYLLNALTSDYYPFRFTAFFTIAIILLILLLIKNLRNSYWIYSLLLFIIPFSTGIESLPRYILVSFPIYILLGVVKEKYPRLGDFLLLSLALVQGMMLVFWTSGFDLLM